MIGKEPQPQHDNKDRTDKVSRNPKEPSVSLFGTSINCAGVTAGGTGSSTGTSPSASLAGGCGKDLAVAVAWAWLQLILVLGWAPKIGSFAASTFKSAAFANRFAVAHFPFDSCVNSTHAPKNMSCSDIYAMHRSTKTSVLPFAHFKPQNSRKRKPNVEREKSRGYHIDSRGFHIDISLFLGLCFFQTR